MDKYVELARMAIGEYIKNKKIMVVPENLSNDFFSRQAGVFVTIHNGEELRGCIGTYLPTKKNVAEEIVSNAVAACSRDYRFVPITPEELPQLTFEVSILSEPILMKDVKKHDPQKHGIIVRCSDGRCGLLLPDLKGVDTTEQQIEISCQKGAIYPQTDKLELYEFTVEKHG
jgi:AmmeMemoRadiSam system protein A